MSENPRLNPAAASGPAATHDAPTTDNVAAMYHPESTYSLAVMFLPVIRRQWRKMLITSVLVMGVAVAYTGFAPVLYTSEAKLFVRLGRETVVLDPTATTGQTVHVQETRENELNSIQEILTSRFVAERLVDVFGTRAILGNSIFDVSDASETLPDKPDVAAAETVGPISIWTQLNPLATYSVRDKAISKLSKRMRIEPVRKSNIINVSCEAADPGWPSSWWLRQLSSPSRRTYASTKRPGPSISSMRNQRIRPNV